MRSRRFIILTGLVALALPVVAQADWLSNSGPSVPQRAELYSLQQVEVTWHRATSKKNLDLMMSLWAPDAVFILGEKTFKGKPAIRAALSKAGPFQPQNRWVSDSPAYKMRAKVNGDRGTLYFECHYIDVDSQKLEFINGVTVDLKKKAGKWLITKFVGSSPTLSP